MVNYLAKNMAEFFKVLRVAGMNISVSDCISAVEALLYVDVADKTEVRTAMGACLAKDEQGRSIYKRAFDLYFVPAEVRQEYISSKADMIEKRKQEIEAVAERLKFQEKQIELTEDLMEVFAGLPENEQKAIEDFLKTTSAGKNVRAEFMQIAETMVKGKLSTLRQKYRKSLAGTRGVLSLDSTEAGIIAEEAGKTNLSEDVLLRKSLGEISDEDVPAVIRLISTLVEKLKKDLARKYKKTGKRTRLDIKRTIRSNLSTGQVMFRLKYKSRPQGKSKLLLLSDVSASMLRFSGFVLQFMLGMSSSFSSIDTYIFSDDSEKINIRNFFGFDDFVKQVKDLKIWGKGTNIGRALGNIRENRFSPVTSSTIFVLVSDAKTIDHKLTLKNLAELSRIVKRILWMNPLPENEWNKIKGLEEYLKYCTMLDCSTLEHLAAACRNL